MPNFQPTNMDVIRQMSPQLADSIQALADALNNVSRQTGAEPQGTPQPPAAPSVLNVTSAGGIFDIQILDNSPANSGVAPDYYLEYSTTPNFAAPIVVPLGPTRNWRRNLGNQTLYWRAYTQIGRASQPSPATYFGPINAPTPVVGGGAVTGPVPLPSAGSGTSPTNGLKGGAGYGALPVRSSGFTRGFNSE
jgi:hypothetical protein